MKCPNCKTSLEEIKISDTKINHCGQCGGLWFEKDELRLVKDKSDENLKWLDFELKNKSFNWRHFEIWKKKAEFQLFKDQRLCPDCQVPLYKVNYGDSRIEIDVCSLCLGVWLDKEEFKKIIGYLKKKADYELLRNYVKNLVEESKEIFVGPENLRSEISDFLTIVKLLKYKFATQYPLLTKLFLTLPK